jgi:hypothetical protein
MTYARYFAFDFPFGCAEGFGLFRAGSFTQDDSGIITAMRQGIYPSLTVGAL